MSLLNNANDGDYSIIRNITKAILELDNSINKDALFSLCGADVSITAEKKIGKKNINDTLNTWHKLGLVDFDGDNVSLREHYLDKMLHRKKFDEQKFKLLLLDILYLPENNKDFWTNEGGGSDDFTRGTTYLFARDVFNTKFENNEGGVDIIKNSNRRSALIRWMYALGIMNSGNVADPTLLVKSFICNDKAPGDYSLIEFVQELAERYPVLDGGVYRTALENKLVGSSYKLLEVNTLSNSLGLALRRLRNQGFIQLFDKSDSAKLILKVDGNTQRYAYISILEGSTT